MVSKAPGAARTPKSSISCRPRNPGKYKNGADRWQGVQPCTVMVDMYSNRQIEGSGLSRRCRPKLLVCILGRSSPARMSRLSYPTVSKFRIVQETRRNRAIIVRNRCVPVSGYRARYYGLGFGPALGPNPVRNRRFLAGSLKVFGALVAQPRCCPATAAV
jgi:hypothetical protein